MSVPYSTPAELKALVEKALSTQAQIDVQISKGHEAETNRLSAIYQSLVSEIFSFEDNTVETVIAKLDFGKALIADEHPMTSLVDMIFNSLREDLLSLRD